MHSVVRTWRYWMLAKPCDIWSNHQSENGWCYCLIRTLAALSDARGLKPLERWNWRVRTLLGAWKLVRSIVLCWPVQVGPSDGSITPSRNPTKCTEPVVNRNTPSQGEARNWINFVLNVSCVVILDFESLSQPPRGVYLKSLRLSVCPSVCTSERIKHLENDKTDFQ